jgi:ribosomal protein L4
MLATTLPVTATVDAVLETREIDPVSLVRFNSVLLTKGAIAQFEEMLG